MKILIVEDEFNAREGLANLIEKISPRFEICGKAADGQTGYEMILSSMPDLVFVDIEMPKLNGLQMIEKIRSSSLASKPAFIILSGYADFEYARQAISFGVDEYLLKPIKYDKLKNVLLNFEKRSGQNKLKYNNVISQEELLRRILQNSDSDSNDALNSIRSLIIPEQMYLISIYYGAYGEISNIAKSMEAFCQFYHFKNYYISTLHKFRCLVALINTSDDLSDVAKKINYSLIFSLDKFKFESFVLSLVPINDLEELSDSLLEIKCLNSWALTLGNSKVIYQNLLPSSNNNQINRMNNYDVQAIDAIKHDNMKELLGINEKLLAYLQRNQFHPEQIKSICTSYVFSILVCFKEFNIDIYQKAQNNDIFEKIKECSTIQELKGCLDDLAGMYAANDKAKLNINSILVKKVLYYIEDTYCDSVSLEKIAEHLNVSPIYLSHLFTKEVGSNFSDYVKNYRISIAKKLMLNSNLKIYEIGDKIGYKDPKYFSKVFKEVTGLSPKDYMIRL